MAEQQISTGGGIVKEGKKAQDDAENALQNSADPLGPQPEMPKFWKDIQVMSRLSAKQETTLKSQVNHLKRIARIQGLSLITVADVRVTKLADDPIMKKDDASILNFLSTLG